jgi:hypothetical protein
MKLMLSLIFLALAERTVVYGRPVAPVGPRITSATTSFQTTAVTSSTGTSTSVTAAISTTPVGSGGRPRLPASKFLFLLSKRMKNKCLSCLFFFFA